jgi:hypothetical protein
MSIVILPSFPLNILPWNLSDRFTVLFIKRSLQELKQIIGDREVISYIRHAPTNRLLSKYFKLIDKSNDQYVFNPADYIIIVTLMKRIPVSGQDVEVSENDLLVVDIGVAKGSWI